MSHVLSEDSKLSLQSAPSFDEDNYRLPPSGIDLNEELKRMEISLLCAALKQCHGVQYKAARLLGIKPTTLNMKLARYSIDVDSFK